MKRIRWLVPLALVILLGASGCVQPAEFQTHKDGVKASGDAVEAWIVAAHENIEWLRNNVSRLCQATPGAGCSDPPNSPPPPPDGGWGM